MDFVYFKPVTGRAVPRYGTAAFVGATLTKDGFVWKDESVAIPLLEYTRYGKEYRHHVAMGDLLPAAAPAPTEPAPLDAAPAEGASQGEPTADRGRRRTRR